jgi:hypothetical protein
MIDIEHNVTVQIGKVNPKLFEVVVHRATPAQVKQLSLVEKAHTDESENSRSINKEISKLDMQIAEKQSMLETNMELLKLSSKELSFADRCTLLWENKRTLIPELVNLKKERMAIVRPDETRSYELVADIYKKRFELFVEESEQKTALAQYAQEKSVSFTEIFMDINSEIAKEEEKKLKASADGQNK